VNVNPDPQRRHASRRLAWRPRRQVSAVRHNRCDRREGLRVATLDGEPRTVPLYLTVPTGEALSRNSFNVPVWKRALRAAGIANDRRNGMHV